jgi:UDP-glucose 4-epimerase
MRILVTGGTGFIGSHLVKRLLDDGHAVAVLTRYWATETHTRASWWKDVAWYEGDIRDLGSLKILHHFKPDVIFHLAAYNHVGQSWDRYEECYDVNAKGTANLLEVRYPSTKFVYMSTSEVYGYQTETPWSEEMEARPESPYGLTKYAGELHCQLMQRKLGDRHSISIVRAFNVFGPAQSTKAVIPRIIGRCLRNENFQNNPGQQKREFNYVEDVVDGLVRAADRDYSGPVNLCAGKNISIRELIERIIELTGSSTKVEWTFKYRPNEIWDLRGNNAKAKLVLGWEPTVDFQTGLERTVEWFKAQR